MAQQYDNTNKGRLFKNNRKEKDSHPDYTGTGNWQGQDFQISAWLKTSEKGVKYFSFSFQEPYQAKEPAKANGYAPGSDEDEPDSEIPF